MATPRKNIQERVTSPKALYFQQLWKANLARVRAARGWTMQECADRAGMKSRVTWHHVESLDTSPRFDTMVLVADTLGVGVEFLLGRIDTEVPPHNKVKHSEKRVKDLGEMISNNIRALRYHKGLTQLDAARLSGIERVRWVELEGNRFHPRLSTIIAVADGMSVEPVLLLEEDLAKKLGTQDNIDVSRTRKPRTFKGRY